MNQQLIDDISEIFNLSPDLMCIVSSDCDFLAVNDSFTKLLGYSRDELLSKKTIEFVHPEDIESTLRVASRLRAGHYTTPFFEQRILKVDGDSVWIAWGAKEKSGKIYATGKDITSVKRNQQLLNDIQKMAKIGTWTVQTSDYSLLWTEETYLIHEIQPGTPIDIKMALGFFSAADRGIINHGLKRCLEEGKQFEREFQMTTALGRSLWVRGTCKAIHDHSGNVIEARGSIQDISDIKELEFALRKTTLQLSDVLEHSPGVVCHYDLDVHEHIRFIFANDQTIRLFEFSPDQLVANAFIFKKMMDPSDWLNLDQKNRSSRQTMEPFQWLGRCSTESGSMKWIKLTSQPRTLDNGSVSWNAIITDVTRETKLLHVIEHQKRLTEKKTRLAAISDHANIEKSKFLANMSHEIRTPLAAIIGFVDLLQSDFSAPGEYLSIISRNANHLSTLIDDVLDLSKVEAGQLTIDIKTVELETELEAVVAMLSRQATLKGLVIHTSFDRSCPRAIQTDPRRLRQILINLIGNAIKFTCKGSVEIDVTSTSEELSGQGPQIAITVSDTGCGIPTEMQESIFLPFNQGAAPINGTFGGTGLGLALSRQLAKLLGGKIVCKRSEVGAGSSFEITICPNNRNLDTKASAFALSPANADQRKSLAGLTVLLVDDAPDIRLLISLMLKSLGATVALAEGGQQGVKMALKDKYDVILMDIKMPIMNGRTATDKLRTLGCETPIIALSADATEVEKGLCLTAGINEYCSKPISIEELYRVVSKWSNAAASHNHTTNHHVSPFSADVYQQHDRA
jgi:PAS domain S-box-containing protein